MTKQVSADLFTVAHMMITGILFLSSSWPEILFWLLVLTYAQVQYIFPVLMDAVTNKMKTVLDVTDDKNICSYTLPVSIKK